MEEKGLVPVTAVEVIECDDLDAAVSLAATHPMASAAHI
jgi:hypothetical protein